MRIIAHLTDRAFCYTSNKQEHAYQENLMTFPDAKQQEDFLRFLLEVKGRTYAAQGDKATVPPVLPDAKQLEWRKGDWLYRDLHFSMNNHDFVFDSYTYIITYSYIVQ
jgi:hypothetical protein